MDRSAMQVYLEKYLTGGGGSGGAGGGDYAEQPVEKEDAYIRSAAAAP